MYRLQLAVAGFEISNLNFIRGWSFPLQCCVLPEDRPATQVDFGAENAERLENSHRAAADTATRANEVDQSTSRDQQQSKGERGILDIEMNVLPPTRLAVFHDSAPPTFSVMNVLCLYCCH